MHLSDCIGWEDEIPAATAVPSTTYDTYVSGRQGSARVHDA
jgi:hypothetical protein